jgi:predicted subunit of tRNA(5-methylaminomethyl-2-thiouridylate) methyltransferase
LLHLLAFVVAVDRSWVAGLAESAELDFDFERIELNDCVVESAADAVAFSRRSFVADAESWLPFELRAHWSAWLS